MGVSNRDVYAHWGYTEINSDNFGPLYDGMTNVKVLRAAQKCGAAFYDIMEMDREYLAHACRYVRQAFKKYTDGIQNFEEVEIDKTKLASIFVPFIIARLPIMPFAKFMDTASPEPGDCRNVTPPDAYTKPTDPIIVGHDLGQSVLIDGYHRAALFWKFAEPHSTIRAYTAATR